MQLKRLLKNTAVVITSLVRYNLSIIFAGKFIYFLIAALAIFLFVTGSQLFSADSMPSEATVFRLLLVPGLLLIFYPVTFGIQNDVDSRMIEILFGIPNYRYKVWMVRLLLIFAMTGAILLVLAFLSSVALITVPLFEMLFQLLFPVVFLGCLAFMVSTVVRNGSGTAVVMVIIGMVFLLGTEFFENYPKWNIFLNPFDLPQDMNEVVWAAIVVDNRIFLFAGTVIALLYGLLSLQKREKFL
ncbi:MAG: hypothetical protein JXQ83_07520 [Candidatus Glassbacteria bacterium]|nr:hypothetical protein [Candidatus Glassbacteria bacterium]